MRYLLPRTTADISVCTSISYDHLWTEENSTS